GEKLGGRGCVAALDGSGELLGCLDGTGSAGRRRPLRSASGDEKKDQQEPHEARKMTQGAAACNRGRSFAPHIGPVAPGCAESKLPFRRSRIHEPRAEDGLPGHEVTPLARRKHLRRIGPELSLSGGVDRKSTRLNSSH